MELGHPIAAGNTAKVYIVQDKIVKLFREDLPEGTSSYEAEKQRYALSKGLPVPKIMDVTKIDGRQAIIMEKISGRTLGERLLENKNLAHYYMEMSVNIQQNIHRINADAFEPMNEKLTRQIGTADRLSQSQKTALLFKLSEMPVKKQLCHGDLHLFNLIMGDNVTIIDWVDASAGDSRADVYRTYLLYTQFSSELAELYLQLYCTKSGLSKDEVMEWAPIIAGARLSEGVLSEDSDRLLEIVNKLSLRG
ncbi:phosphotransferase family protein [Pseudalkalibacillus hwajinpoensis]|uniref:phosphotransferase family protein n=1 Tax=Guptibacillus hwajinpoensis TaxID=208199 RepID=UPI001CD63933|nr:aminoglycoside phosphotransferase family protein [Pseudalkalibacillus hwajinpoensis]MCA0990278.1 aminoglycoside phosphotransferase family protein [Pseudalkalibacillus hwajinpoensis]